MDLAELLAALAADGAVAALSDDDLTTHEATLDAAIDAAVEAADLETLTSIEAAVTAIRTEATTRHEAAEARAAEIAEVVARIRPPEPEVTDDDAESDPADADATAETPAPVEDTPPPPVAEAPAPAPVAAVPDAPAEAPAPAEVPVAVAASAARTVQRAQIRPVGPPPSLGRAQARAGAQHRPAPTPAASPFSIVASAEATGQSGGQGLSVGQLDRALGMTIDSFGSRPASNPGPRVQVASIITDYPEERRLSDTDGPGNERKVAALVASARANLALVASGGPCAAPAVDYSQNPIGTADRPLAQGLMQVNGSRGAVSYMQPPKIGDFAAGVGVWTQATDITPGGSTKPCVSITCGDYVTAKTEALTVCATIGNWIARNYDERVQALRQLLAVEASRFAESRHLTAIGAGSMKIPKTHVLGAARDVLTRLDLTLAQARYQYRMGEGDPIDVLAPRWLQDMMQADLTRELPGSYAERLATSDAQIAQFFAARGVNPVWLMDAEASAAPFVAAADGVATKWPNTASIYVYPSGSWKMLDDGELNLSVSGPYHDSVLNKTNDAQIWWETFENVYFQGTWSRRLDIEVCPTGTTSGTTAVACLTGS